MVPVKRSDKKQEARSILNHNLRGTFIIKTAIDFHHIPPVILALIDVAIKYEVIQHLVKPSIKSQYLLNFPNLKTFVVGTFVASWHNVRRDIKVQHPFANRTTFISYVEEFFNDIPPRYAYTNRRRPKSVPKCHPMVSEYIPKSWQLFSGKCPVEIVIQIYVAHKKTIPDVKPRRGLLVTYDYSRGRVVFDLGTCDLGRRANLFFSTKCTHWWSPDAWEMLEPEKVSEKAMET